MKIKYITAILAFISFIASCKREPDPEPIDDGGIVVPTTYNFTNVNYSGQTQRISMLSEMTTLMKTGNTSGTTVDANVLKNMFRNSGNPFTLSDLNTSGKNLICKCFYLDTTYFLNYMDSLALCSISSVPGSNGTAGVVVSPSDNTKKYLFNERGIEITQLIEKGLMGGVFYYQSLAVYFSDDKIGNHIDNTTVTAGSGTTMEHHWDEGFGYFGAPIDFPTNTTGMVYWAKYSNTVNASLGTNITLMNAFIAGRFAISNGDMTAKFTQRDIIRSNWEKVCAASVIHYYNEALANLTDDAVRNHTLSEALAFLRCLKYSPVKIITNQQISDIEAMIGNNFYNVTINGINNAKDELSTIYNLDSVKDDL
jgi:hypothetical protein